MLREWSLHYARWVIEDGYPDREVGTTFEWSNVDFGAEPPLTKTGVRSKIAIPTADFGYSVTGEVACLSDEGCLLDFGLRATGRRRDIAPNCKEGDYVTGKIGLSVQCDLMYLSAAVYDTLKCRWHVNRITADLTPHVLNPDIGCFVRDETRIQLLDVKSTAEVNATNYILHCTEAR